MVGLIIVNKLVNTYKCTIVLGSSNSVLWQKVDNKPLNTQKQNILTAHSWQAAQQLLHFNSVFVFIVFNCWRLKLY